MKAILYIFLITTLYSCANHRSDISTSIDQPHNVYSMERIEWERSYLGENTDPMQAKAAKRNAKNLYQRQRKEAVRDGGISGWIERGPSNIGGRVRALATHPTNANILYAGGVHGGIWKSFNKGNTWQKVTNDEQDFPITSIAVDHTNPSVIYATTGNTVLDYVTLWSSGGYGILKSVDGGFTWTNTYIGGDVILGKVAISPNDPTILIATGAENIGGLYHTRAYHSSDAGANWSDISTGLGLGLGIDIEINPQDAASIFIGTSNNLYHTSTGGASWVSQLGFGAGEIPSFINYIFNRYEIDICKDNPDIAYVSRYYQENLQNTVDTVHSEVWKSTAGSTPSWTLEVSTQTHINDNIGYLNNIHGAQGWHNNALWIDPLDCDRFIIGGIDLFKYENQTLTRISNWPDDIGGNVNGQNNSVHSDQHAIIPSVDYNNMNGNSIYIANDGGVYYTDDIWAASTNSGWASRSDGLRITQMYAVDTDNTGQHYIGGSQDNSYFSMVANGTNTDWTYYSTGDGGHGHVSSNSAKRVFSTQNGAFVYSPNGGTTRLPLINLSGDNPAFIAPLEPDPTTENVVYVASQNIYRIDLDSGPSIDTILTYQNQRITALAISPVDNQKIIFGTNLGIVWETDDGGQTWQTVNFGNFPARFVSDISYNPQDANEMLITFAGGYHSDGLWRTDNDGTSWYPLGFVFPEIFTSCSFHPEIDGWLYLGTSTGIYASENDGVDWSIDPLFSENEGPVYTGITEIEWYGDGTDTNPYHMVVSTIGRGVWSSLTPLRDKVYVDRSCTACGAGTWSMPYATFREAVDYAAAGNSIYFKSGGDYDEVPLDILINKKLNIKLHPSASSHATVK